MMFICPLSRWVTQQILELPPVQRISKLASKKKWPETSTQDRRNVALGLEDSTLFFGKTLGVLKKNHKPQAACTHFVDLIYFEKHRWNQLKNPLKYGNVLQAYGKVVPLVTIGGFSEKSRTNISLENSKIIFKKQNGETIQFASHITSIVSGRKNEQYNTWKETPGKGDSVAIIGAFVNFFGGITGHVLKDWPVRREPSAHCNLITKHQFATKFTENKEFAPQKWCS